MALPYIVEQFQQEKQSEDITQDKSIFSIGTGKNDADQDVDITSSVEEGQLNECRILARTYTNLFGEQKTYSEILALASGGNIGFVQDGTIVPGTGDNYVDLVEGNVYFVKTDWLPNTDNNTNIFRTYGGTVIADNTQLGEIVTIAGLSSYIMFTAPATDKVKLAWRNNVADSNYYHGKSIIVDLTAEGETETDVDVVAQKYTYVDGTKSTLPLRLKTINTNLFDGEFVRNESYNGTTGISAILPEYSRNKNRFIKIPSDATKIIISNNSSSLRTLVYWYDANKNFISFTDVTNQNAQHTKPTNAVYYNFSIQTIDENIIVWNSKDITIEYEPHQSSESYINWGENGEGRSVGSTYDEVCLETKTLTIKNNTKALTNILWEGNQTNIRITRILNPSDVTDSKEPFFNNSIYDSIELIDNATGQKLQQVSAIGYDDTINIGKYFTDAQGLFLITAIDIVPTVNHRLNYQLATPIIQELQGLNQLTAYPNGTLIVDHAIKDQKIYSDTGIAINDTTLPIDSMESVYKIEYVDGQEIMTPVDLSDVTVAGDGLSFTITGATTGEKYEYIYHYPSELSTIPTIVYSVPLNTKATISGNNARSIKNADEIVEIWETLVEIAKKEILMFSIAEITTDMSADTFANENKNKINEILTIW